MRSIRVRKQNSDFMVAAIHAHQNYFSYQAFSHDNSTPDFLIEAIAAPARAILIAIRRASSFVKHLRLPSLIFVVAGVEVGPDRWRRGRHNPAW
jgi:hypothetical protein